MANCNDCVHHDICSLWSTTDLIQDEAQKYCNGNFKNKADVVEVVRCMDCKYGDFYCNSILCGNSHAPWYNDEFDALMELDDYCSYGERKCNNG